MRPNEHANDLGRWPRVVVLLTLRPHTRAGRGSPAVAAVLAGAVAVAVRPDDGAVGDHRRAATGPDLQTTAGPVSAVPRADGADQRGARARLRRGRSVRGYLLVPQPHRVVLRTVAAACPFGCRRVASPDRCSAGDARCGAGVLLRKPRRGNRRHAGPSTRPDLRLLFFDTADGGDDGAGA